MAQISYRANLSSAIFPMSLAQAGRSVIVPGPDNNYDRRVDPEGEQKDAGIPQAIYLENVIPTANGYQSVGYASATNITLGGAPNDREVYRTVVIGDYVFAFVIGSSGYDEVYTKEANSLGAWSAGASNWLSILGAPYVGVIPFQVLSTATIRSVTYVFVNLSTSLASISDVTLTDVSGAVTGIALADVDFILSSFNYLIAVKNDGTVCWSSTTTPLDFTVSLVTGAGSAKPNAVRSQIVAAYESPDGFILYTKDNAVAAIYTGNSRYPWRFKEISETGGHKHEYNVSAIPTASTHFSYNNHGTIVQLASDGSRQLAAEVSTYVRNAKVSLDTYNRTSKIFESDINALAVYRIYYLLSKYIILQFTSVDDVDTKLARSEVYSIIYDTQLRRYGKLSGNHSHLWEYDSDIFALGAYGECVKIEFNIEDTTAVFNSVIAFGKFQYARSRNLCVDEVSIEGEIPSATVELVKTLDGKTYFPGETGVPSTNTSEIITCPFRSEGRNHIAVVKGQFSLSTLELIFHLGGGR